MARIAINAVVDVTSDMRVLEIGRIVVSMAPRALKDCIVARIRMAGAANSVRAAVLHVKERVILRRQVRRRPCRGGVACVAGRRPRCGLVIWVRGVVVVRYVATGTDGRQRGVVVVHVATAAGHGYVGAAKRKGRGVVVKRALTPGHRVVTRLASRRKTQLNVIHGCQSVVVVGLVTTDAGRARQTVVVIDVAQSAAHRYVRAGQRPSSRGVIECRRRPRRS